MLHVYPAHGREGKWCENMAREFNWNVKRNLSSEISLIPIYESGRAIKLEARSYSKLEFAFVLQNVYEQYFHNIMMWNKNTARTQWGESASTSNKYVVITHCKYLPVRLKCNQVKYSASSHDFHVSWRLNALLRFIPCKNTFLDYILSKNKENIITEWTQ